MAGDDDLEGRPVSPATPVGMLRTYCLSVVCERCTRRADMPVEALARQHRLAWDAQASSVEPRLRCRACGARGYILGAIRRVRAAPRPRLTPEAAIVQFRGGTLPAVESDRPVEASLSGNGELILRRGPFRLDIAPEGSRLLLALLRGCLDGGGQ